MSRDSSGRRVCGSRRTLSWMRYLASELDRASNLRSGAACSAVMVISKTFYYILEWVLEKKPQRAQRTQRKQQLSVPSVSSVVNLLRHNQSPPGKKLKSLSYLDVISRRLQDHEPVKGCDLAVAIDVRIIVLSAADCDCKRDHGVGRGDFVVTVEVAFL